MKKTNNKAAQTAKTDVTPAETSHFKNGHRWLAWITGLTTIWVGITFILGLCGDVDLPRSMQYLNVWYLVNLAVITLTACYATFAILKKCPSQIFWSGTAMYIMLLQSISLIIFFFAQQDTASINAIVMFVWSVLWYGYMVISPSVEADLPSRHRSHHKFGEVFVAIMTASTVGYGIMMCIKLL